MKPNKPFTIVAFGEILWDLLPDSSILGGAPFNFVYRINSLGNKGYIISRVGNDDIGKEALSLVIESGMSTEFIQVDHMIPTGIVNVFFDESKKPDFTIVRDVAYDFIRYDESLEGLVTKADCLCYGTLIQRNEVSGSTLYQLLRSFNGTYRLYDINLRKDCYSREIIDHSLRHADILKLNDDEAVELSKILHLDAGSLPETGKRILHHYPVQICIITMGEKGALVISKTGEIIYEPGFRIRLEDSLGAGDAFSAGFIHKLLSGSGLQEACRYGNMMGAVVSTQKGATQSIDIHTLESFPENTERNIEFNLRHYIKH
jgi:fructokinase